jgi:hypothetical protein
VQLLHGGVVLQNVTYHQDGSVPVRGLDETGSALKVECQGLLDQDVLPRFHGEKPEFDVRRSWSR